MQRYKNAIQGKKLKKKWTEKQGKDTKKAFAIINFYRKLLSVLTQQKKNFLDEKATKVKITFVCLRILEEVC